MKSLHILLVEDNEGDILLTTEALEETKMPIKLSVAKDGQAAIEVMDQQVKTPGEEVVDLVLLDVNLPKKNGHEVLTFIKGNMHLKDTPVVMLTTSNSPKDISRSHQNKTDGYLVKPLEARELLKVMANCKSLQGYIGPSYKEDYDKGQ